MREVLRASLYLPIPSDGHRRIRGSDEDEFTIAATAVERAIGDPPIAERRWNLRFIGGEMPPEPGTWQAFLGGPVTVSRSPGSVPAFEESLRDALAGSGTEVVVVVSSAGPVPSGKVEASLGDAAVALLVDDVGADPRPPLRWDTLPRDVPVIPALRTLADTSQGPSSSRWVGDWGEDPAVGRPASPTAPLPAPTGPLVSQGAFVPKPRYLEGLPSRWRLVGDRCRACGRITFPRRGRCRGCGRTEEIEPTALPRDGGSVLAITWIGAGGQPTEFDFQMGAGEPYGVALVQLAPGVTATFAVADARRTELALGDAVDTRLRRLYAIDGEWRYGRKAVPRSTRVRPPMTPG